jgi:hypothetical protein
LVEEERRRVERSRDNETKCENDKGQRNKKSGFRGISEGFWASMREEGLETAS